MTDQSEPVAADIAAAAKAEQTGSAPAAVAPSTEAKAAVTDAAAGTPAASAPAAAAAAAAPANTAATEASEPKKEEPEAQSEAAPKSPFDQLAAKVLEIAASVGHDEMWGVKILDAATDVPSAVVVQKFLNANDGDLAKAVEQFTAALTFRKERKPLELLDKTFSAAKFGSLGVVTWYDIEGSKVPEVFTWNTYGNVKDRMEEVFTPLEEFMEFRIALQELGVKHLNIAGATERITETNDPYKMTQVHDYKSVSFFRQSPSVKAASTEVIKQFATAYPELLKEKFFVNVPAVMGWLYGVMKLFVAEKTRKKFHPMANGANLVYEFKASKIDEKQLPKEYGGTAGSGDGTLKNLGGGEESLKFA